MAYLKTLYVRRNLENADELIAWAKAQGFPTTQTLSHMHVTIAYSKALVDWPPSEEDFITVDSNPWRTVERLGDKGAVVLKFRNTILTRRWKELCDVGCSWDYDGYQPHVTISWQVDPEFDLKKVAPYKGELKFGPEIFDEIREGWMDTNVEKAVTFKQALEKVGARHTRGEFKQIQDIHDTAVTLGATCAHDNVVDGVKTAKTASGADKVLKCELLKVDDKLGLLFGWAIICKEDGQDYWDSQDDHVPEESMLKAATDFMQSKRVMKVMHAGKAQGTVVFAWPLTAEIAKAMGIKTNKTGLMIGVKPDSQDILDKFTSGEYTGFSIGGSRLHDEAVE